MKQIKSISLGLLLTIVMAVALFTSCKKEEEGNTHINADGVTGTLTDTDGNTYAIVKIGDQWWMAENLRVTNYNDDTAIPNVTDATEWSNLTDGGYASYNNDESYIKEYGVLYNWYAVGTGKLAPEGWHVAVKADWDTLNTYLTGNYGTSGSVAKALASTTGWMTSTITNVVGNNQSINNCTGFCAMPGGYRNSGGVFRAIGNYSIWWLEEEASSSGDALIYYLSYNYTDLYYESDYKECGFSVRCVMD